MCTRVTNNRVGLRMQPSSSRTAAGSLPATLETSLVIYGAAALLEQLGYVCMVVEKISNDTFYEKRSVRTLSMIHSCIDQGMPTPRGMGALGWVVRWGSWGQRREIEADPRVARTLCRQPLFLAPVPLLGLSPNLTLHRSYRPEDMCVWICFDSSSIPIQCNDCLRQLR